MIERYLGCPPWPSTTFRPPVSPASIRLSGDTLASFAPRKILGISAFFHDAAAALVVDGVPVAAAQEERFTRRKNDSRFPREAIRYCLAEAAFDIEDIDLAMYYEEPFARADRMLSTQAARGSPADQADCVARAQSHLALQSSLAAALGYSGPIGFVPHHVSHAAYGFYASPFDQAACLIADGVGEWATTTLASASSDGIQVIEEIDYPHSLGLFYSAMTRFLGFSPLSDEGKVMGLAAFDEPHYLTAIENIVRRLRDGSFALDLDTIPVVPGDDVAGLEAALGLPQLDDAPHPDSAYAGLAASVQETLERRLCEIAVRLQRLTDSRNVVLGGGVALNSAANHAVLRECGFERIFVPPAAGDAGSALGAALFAANTLNSVETSPEWHDPFLGPAFDSDDIERIVADAGLRSETFVDDKVVGKSAELLADGATVGWLHGRMEFGPRSLGARSILADPTREDTQDKVNAQVKFRESFRPFAPSLPEEDASMYFDFGTPPPFPAYYMLLVAPVIAEARSRIPSVVHVDGTARPQLVSQAHQPRFHKLLRTFEQHSGVPILLNTSFNLSGEPIVCTPADAIRTFRNSQLDFLILEDTLVHRD